MSKQGSVTLTLLCNAGFAIETDTAMLLLDAPNRNVLPFASVPDDIWRKLLRREWPFDKLCGFWFTHEHPDHCNLDKVAQYRALWPDTPVFVPTKAMLRGRGEMGPFRMEYQRFPHAPIENPPPHVVTWIEVGDFSIYVSGDAALEPEAHRAFLRGRKANVAIWNPMYLSRPETRALLAQAANRNLICHLPNRREDTGGYWKKAEHNLTRYGDELKSVTILSEPPVTIEL